MNNGMYLLENKLWKVTLSSAGMLHELFDKESETQVRLEHLSVCEMDWGCFCPQDLEAVNVIHSENAESTEMIFQYHTFFCNAEVRYVLPRHESYLQKCISLTALDKPITLLNVAEQLSPVPFPQEFIPYDTFWNSPTAVFLRWPHSGVFAGYENPFFEASGDKQQIRIAYQPSLMLAPGETYQSEAFFCGLTTRKGCEIIEDIPKTSLYANGRYHTRYRNPSGHLPLDLGEIRAFSRYAEHYLQAQIPQFELVYYMYWTPLKPDDEKRYCHLLDAFHELGGDSVILVPPLYYEAPRVDGLSLWELAPQGSAMERVIAHARNLDLKIGFYTGSASGHSEHCIGCMTDFDPDHVRGWGKRDHQGKLSHENCLADDDFARWYGQCIQNTIDQYHLKVFGWDPGPGNGLFCYAANHGHIPGKGGYKGWRNAMQLTHDLYEANEGIYFQGFHGTKEYGLWGQLHTHQNESYWEQKPGQMAALPPDYSADRITAYGMSQQSYWNQLFRFLPPYVSHALAHRMYQSCHSPLALMEDFDWSGYRYAFLSALSTGACVTLPIIPDNLENLDGLEYKAFVQKWSQWARETWQYAPKTVPLQPSPTPGAVHGTARVLDREGFLFLFNPNPRETLAHVPLDWTIGLESPGEYMLEYMYPWNGGCVQSSADKPWLFRHQETAHIPVPSREAVVLHLCADDGAFHHAGRGGVMSQKDSIIHLDHVSGQPGERRSFALGTRIMVNGIDMLPDGSEYIFDGEELPRQLDGWEYQQQKQPAVFRMEPGTHEVKTRFYAPGRMEELLKQAQVPDPEKHRQKIAQLRQMIPHDCYLWAQPYRLFLTIPFDDANKVTELSVSINGTLLNADSFRVQTYQQVTTMGWYLDITDYVQYDAINEVAVNLSASEAVWWMGPTLEYPLDAPTEKLHPVAPLTREIQNGRPLSRQKPRRSNAASERNPLILNAWASSAFASDEDVTIFASVNLPEDELEGVYMAAQVNITQRGRGSCFSDIPMTFDRQTGLYSHVIENGDRKQTILDAPELHFWCIDKNGSVSPTFHLPVQWKL